MKENRMVGMLIKIARLMKRILRRSIDFLLYYRYAFGFRYLYVKNYFKKIRNNRSKSFLFWVPGGMSLLLHVEGAIATALRLRGHQVHAIICDGAYKACIRREITDGISIEDWPKICTECIASTTQVLQQMGVPFSYIGDYVSKTEINEARQLAKNAQWSTIEELAYNDLLIGKNVKSAILRYLRGQSEPTDIRIVEEYAFSGFITAIASKNAYNSIKPNQIYMSHGIYVDWGPALHTALSYKLPVTAWMGSYLSARFYFRNIEDSRHLDFHNLSSEGWQYVYNRNFSVANKTELLEYLKNRYTKDTSFDMKEFKKYTGNIKAIKSRYRLNNNKPIWGILSHINWDCVSDYSPMIYDSFNEWILETIKIIEKVSEVQWLIKVHPAEAWDNPDTGTEALIKNKIGTLPANIRLISAYEEISPLDFFGLVDGAVTVYGTSGLELSLLGKPVILAGDAHYGNKGFTYDAKDAIEYKSLLQQAEKLSQLSEKEIETAQKYAYCYFLQRQIPVSVVENPHDKWWSFQYSRMNKLLPHNDPVMDFICDRIVDGKDFIMDDNLMKCVKNREARNSL